MRRSLLIVLLAGCQGAPEPMPAIRLLREEGYVYVGDPGRVARAPCHRLGVWRADEFEVDHWLYDPVGRKRHTSRDDQADPGLTLFRRVLPFPQVKWSAGEFEVTQLLFPVGEGFVARYQVTNHAGESRACRLFIAASWQPGPHARAPQPIPRVGRSLQSGPVPQLVSVEEPGTSQEGATAPGIPERPPTLSYDLSIEAGASRFVHVFTEALGGTIPQDALEAAAARWEAHLAGVKVIVPDEAVVTAYYADLAGGLLGVRGCAQALARLHARLYRAEGDALRIPGDVPDSWLGESIEVENIPTPFGELSYRYEGGFARRTLEIRGPSRPPGGYIVPVPAGLRALSDGTEVAVRDGSARIPAGARRVELLRPE